MSTVVIDTSEVQQVVHAAIVSWGATVADCVLPEGGTGANLDMLDEIGNILRACRATDELGNLGEPRFALKDFGLREPRVYEATRHIVAEWVDWCQVRAEEARAKEFSDDPTRTEEFTNYWSHQAEAAERVLGHIDDAVPAS